MESNLLIAYAALGTMAVVPIYYGSFASVKWPKKKKTECAKFDHEAESSDEEDSSTESLSTEDAYLFPIIGSVVLFSLYLVFKLLNKDYVNYLVTGYFAFLGVIAVTNVGVYIVKNVIGLKVDSYKIRLTKKAEAFAFNAIQMLSLDSFKTGMILLSGLFFYDIFWVFGTEVMITVAKSFDAPIKVVWPKQLLGLQPGEALQFTMLGLGDIVIPGIYVALCLRFDHNLHLKRNPTAKKYSKFSTPYFNSCFTSYILGLITTIVVMHTFKAAQPALLYLSPACIISVLVTGLFKSQIREIFTYSTDDPEKKDKKKDDDVDADGDKKGQVHSEDDDGDNEAVENEQQQTVRKRTSDKKISNSEDDDDDTTNNIISRTNVITTTEIKVEDDSIVEEVLSLKKKKSKKSKSKK
nr:10826_t:CDS:2 [Entrophospora candida]